jgi:PEP-CTERM motif
LNSGGTAASVLKFADDGGGGVPLSTIALPQVASGSNKPFSMSGTSTSEGFLALSSNGQYLTLAGYASQPGDVTTTIPQTDSAVVNRLVARIKVSDGSVDTSTALTDAYPGSSGNNSNPRSVVSDDGTHFWLTGTSATTSAAGVRYTTLGSTTSTQLSSTPTNTRVVTIQNGQLYVSTMSGAFRGVNTVGTGVPTTSGQTTTLLTGFDPATNSAENAFGYWFASANTLYVADQRTAAGGGIPRWDQSGGTWGLSYTFSVGASLGASGLAGTIVGGNPVLYATTVSSSASAANNLVMVTDTGAGSTVNTLFSSPTMTAFRGIAFVGAAPAGVAGDYNNNGIVDAADYTVWRDHLGQTAPGYVLPNDGGQSTGVVDAADYTFWKSRFGAISGSGAGSLSSGAVPEPGSIALAAIGLVGLIIGRRRFGR